MGGLLSGVAWVVVAAYGARFAWLQMQPELKACLARHRAMQAWAAPAGGLGGLARAAGRAALRKAVLWLFAWVILCTVWSALLLCGWPAGR